VTTKQMQVPEGRPNHTGKTMKNITHITIHETGNKNAGATAEAHARYQYNGGGGRAASWHYTADEKEIWQSFPDNATCWHTGTAKGNETSIGIEICANSKEGFRKACENAAALCAELMKRHRIPISNVTQHHHWSRKNCPENLRSGAWGTSWQDFLRMIGRNAEAEKTGIAALDAMAAAGAQFDPRHWADTLQGKRPAKPEHFQELAARAISTDWPLNGPYNPEKMLAILNAITGK